MIKIYGMVSNYKFKYLIVGGGVAGYNAAVSIRQIDKEGSLAIVSEESHLPYDRTVLSKGYLEGRIKKESIFFKKIDFYEKNSIKLFLNKRVTELDASNKIVKTEDGEVIEFDKLLLATGGKARKLKIEGSELKNVFYLRSLDDCEKIKEAMINAKSAVIIGGGFIGCEVASVFASKGITTTILELTQHLMSRVLDEEMSMFIEDFLRSKGIRILTNTSAKRIIGNHRARAVETSDGEVIDADIVIVGIGISPNVELAEKAGIKIENGIVVDEYLETNVKDIFAAGDVAYFYSPIFKRHLRVEHYDLASKHGRIAGKNMAGNRSPFNELPYFFSHMAELSIYVYGEMNNKYLSIRRGGLDLKNGFLKFYLEDNIINAVLSVNTFREIDVAKELIKSRKQIEKLNVISDISFDLKKLLS